jgi:hypothetical protein
VVHKTALLPRLLPAALNFVQEKLQKKQEPCIFFQVEFSLVLRTDPHEAVYFLQEFGIAAPRIGP